MWLPTLRKCISVLLITVQLAQPVLAATQGQEYRIPLKTLKVTAGQPGVGDGVIDVGHNPTPAEFTITPAAHQFDITNGVRSTRTSLLVNKGTSPAAISGIASNADFTVTSNCPAVLAAGNTCNLSITPTASATPDAFYELGVLAKTANAPVFLQLATVARNSDDPAPMLEFENDLINLGAELAPGEAASGIATLVNLGNAPATLGGLVSNPEFSVTSDCPVSLPGGGRCRLSASFSSYVPKTHYHTVSVTSGVTGDSRPVTFYATVKSDPVKRPALAFTPSLLSFGPVDVDATVTKTTILSNTGPVPAVLAPFTSSPDFSVKSDCPTSIPSGEHCTVAVTFTALASGTFPSYPLEAQAQDKVYTRLFNQGQVTGIKDTTPRPELTFAPADLDFGNVPAGQVVVRRAVLSNVGSVAASVKSVTVDYGQGEFSQVNDCGAKIAPAATCEVTVSFKPSTLGQRPGRVRIETAESSDGILLLSGMSQAATLVTGPTSVQLGAIALPGVSRPKSVSLANTGNIPLTGISILTSDNRLAIGYGDCTDTLQPNTGCTLTLQYAPVTDGVINSSFKVSSTNGGSATVAVVGAAVSLSVTPSNVDFPATVEGASAADQSITLTNTGAAAMALDGVSISAGGLYFNQSNNCGETLPARASCRVTVRYTPSNVAANTSTTQQGALSVALRSTEVARVALAGTGLNPRLVIAPNTLRAPAALVGRSATPASFNVTNPTAAPVRVSGMSIITGAAEFAQSNNCGAELAPGTSCLVNILFTPTDKGERAGVWAAATSLGSYTVGLSGEGTVTLEFTATALNFSTTNIGKSSEVLTVVVRNPTALAADLGGPGYGMSILQGSGDFGQANNCGQSLAAGASCSVNFKFTPSVEGDRTGSWLAASSFGNYGITLTGTGVRPEGAVDPTITPGGPTSDGLTHYAITFLDTEVGVPSAVRDIKFINRGTGPLAIQGIALSSGEADFSQSNNCGEVLPAGKFCTISLLFTPSALGSRTGNVVLLSETGNYSFDMSGKGMGASGQWTADTTADFGDVALGGSAQRNFTLKNTGTLTAKNLAVSLTGSDLALRSNSCGTAQAPVSIAAGGSCKVSVVYSPTVAGKLTGGALVAEGRLANGPVTLALAGNAPAPVLEFNAAPSGDFGAVTVGTSNTRTFVLKNSGKFADVLTPAPTVSGTGFAITGGTCADGLSLPVNGTCTIVVTESANSTGPLTGTVTATSKQGATTQLALTANAIQSEYAISGAAGATAPPETDYGQLTAGTPSPVVKYYYLRDNSNAAVVAASVVALQGDSSFTVTNVSVVNSAGGVVSTCAATATGSTAKCSAQTPGQAVRVGVKFAPTSTGTKSVTLHFEHNGTQGYSDVQLTGTGVFDANGAWSTDWTTMAAPTATTTNYGNRTVGTGTADKTIYVQNSGKYGGAAVGFTLSGDSSQFQIVSVIRVGWGGNGGYASAACLAGGVIAADKLSATPCLAQEPGRPSTSQVAVTVRFAPKAAGTYNLTITPTTNNGTILPEPLTLTGTGLFNPTGAWSSAPNSTTAPTAAFLAYGSLATDASADKTIYVRNTGTNGAEAVGFTLSGDSSQFQIVSIIRAGVGGNGGYATASCLAGGVIAADKLSATPCLAQEPGWPATPHVAVTVRFAPKAAGSYNLTVTPTTNNGTVLPEPLTLTGTGR